MAHAQRGRTGLAFRGGASAIGTREQYVGSRHDPHDLGHASAAQMLYLLRREEVEHGRVLLGFVGCDVQLG